jgi:ribonuclease BN (tRNA processing enzyme)
LDKNLAAVSIITENEHMKVNLVPSAVSPSAGKGWQFHSTYIINDRVALDAGALGLLGDLGFQSEITHVVLTHSHLDHTAGLPVFLDNTYLTRPEGALIHATEATLEILRRDLFSDGLWQNYSSLAAMNPPYIRVSTIEPGRSFEIEGLRFTPFPVNHAVPTVGFIVEEPGVATVVFSADTGPTDELWHRANALPRLDAVFLECSFPNFLESVAATAKHLTPTLFAREVQKLHRPAKIVAIHIKPRFFGQVCQDFDALGLLDLRIAQAGETLRFE